MSYARDSKTWSGWTKTIRLHGTPALLLTGSGHQLLSRIIKTHHQVSPVLWQVFHTRNILQLPVLGRQQRCSMRLMSRQLRQMCVQ
eukprot:4869016-Ditylum_brightwellii.AAC.1